MRLFCQTTIPKVENAECSKSIDVLLFLETRQPLTVGVVALPTVEANLGDGADDAAVGAPLADQVHDPVCDLLDESHTPPLVLSRLKHSEEKHRYCDCP